MVKQFFITVLLFAQLVSSAQDVKTRDVREITDLSVYKDGTLHWLSMKEHNNIPYVIEQFRWNKWIKVGEVDAVGTPTKNQYAFHPAPYRGENTFRVRPYADASPDTYKEVKWTYDAPEINFTIHKKKEITFTVETMYELTSVSGELYKKGYSLSISIENLPKGEYILYYDNLSAKFKK